MIIQQNRVIAFYIFYYFIILLYEYRECRQGSKVGVVRWLDTCGQES